MEGQKWIRSVCNTEHGQIPDKLAEPFKLLDIVEMEVEEELPEDHQSQNVLFGEDSIKIVGSFEKNKLETLCDNKKFIFGNAGKALSQDFIENMEYSLMLLKLNEFEVFKNLITTGTDSLSGDWSFYIMTMPMIFRLPIRFFFTSIKIIRIY